MTCYKPRVGFLPDLEPGVHAVMYDSDPKVAFYQDWLRIGDGTFSQPPIRHLSEARSQEDLDDPTCNIQIPCGYCIGCREKYSKDWAARCWHESQFYDKKCFLTLTFDRNHPEFSKMAPRGSLRRNVYVVEKDEDGNVIYTLDGSPKLKLVSKGCIQIFISKLRSKLRASKYGNPKISYFGCGEYGEKLNNPHYHILLFGFDFPDKKLWKVSSAGSSLFRCSFLEEVWPYGFSTIGDVDFKSAAYVARYALKKVPKFVNPGIHFKHYGRLIPEFVCMTRGLGSKWFDKYGENLYSEEKDFLVVPGKGRFSKQKPPRFYDKLLKRKSPEIYEKIKAQRKAYFELVDKSDSTYERLKVREEVHTKRIDDKLKREFTNV